MRLQVAQGLKPAGALGTARAASRSFGGADMVTVASGAGHAGPSCASDPARPRRGARVELGPEAMAEDREKRGTFPAGVGGRAAARTLRVAHLPCYRATVIRLFADGGTEDIFNGKPTRLARKTLPQNLWRVAARKLEQLDSVRFLDELGVPPGNRLEAMVRDRKGQYSIRINDQYRICFVWTETGPTDVEIVDYH